MGVIFKKGRLFYLDTQREETHFWKQEWKLRWDSTLWPIGSLCVDPVAGSINHLTIPGYEPVKGIHNALYMRGFPPPQELINQ